NVCTFFFSSRRRHTRFSRDWSSDVCSSDLDETAVLGDADEVLGRNQAPCRVLPADQCLGAGDAVGLEVDLGMVEEHEFLPLQRLDRKSGRVGKECRSRACRTARKEMTPRVN